MSCPVISLRDDGRQRTFLASTRLADGTVVALVSSRVIDGTPGSAVVRLLTYSLAGDVGLQQDLADVDPLFITGLVALGRTKVAAVWRSREAQTTVSIFETGSGWKRTDHRVAIQEFLPIRVVPTSKGLAISGRVHRTAILLQVSTAGLVVGRIAISDPAIMTLYDLQEQADGAFLFLAGGQSAGKPALLAGRIKPGGEITFKEPLTQDFFSAARLAEGPGGVYALFDEITGGKVRIVSARIQEGVTERTATPIEPILVSPTIGMTRSGDIVVAGFTKLVEFWLLGKPAGSGTAFERCTPVLAQGRQDSISGFHEAAPGLLTVNHGSVIEKGQRAQLRELLKLVSIEWR